LWSDLSKNLNALWKNAPSEQMKHFAMHALGALWRDAAAILNVVRQLVVAMSSKAEPVITGIWFLLG
jgi:hypothetical protein